MMKTIDDYLDAFIDAVEEYSYLVSQLVDDRLFESKKELRKRYKKLAEASLEIFGRIDGAIQAMKENIELFNKCLSRNRALKDTELQNQKLINLATHFYSARRGVDAAKKEGYLDQELLRKKHQMFLSVMQDFYEAMDNYNSKFSGLIEWDLAKEKAKKELFESIERFEKEFEQFKKREYTKV